MNIGVGGAWLPITPFIGVGGSWKSITGAWIGVGGSWKSLNASPLSLVASPTSLSASANSSPPLFRPVVTTGSVTITPSGGTGPYTHSWSIAFVPSGSVDSSGTCSVASPTSATTTFSG
ncbi:hypothetical protein [Rhodanobacter glycinis]|uniref:hypothetical protein n=1 Tax=Rhodanobacter glycinis TaxID=582702 RepID=UPI003D18B13F